MPRMLMRLVRLVGGCGVVDGWMDGWGLGEGTRVRAEDLEAEW